jgi:hypothetical protein
MLFVVSKKQQKIINFGGSAPHPKKQSEATELAAPQTVSPVDGVNFGVILIRVVKRDDNIPVSMQIQNTVAV